MQLTLVLTHNCNLSCQYCYAGNKKVDAMTKETAFKAIDFCFDNCLETTMGLSFFGGEPLLEWELLKECVAYFHEKLPSSVKKVGHSVTVNGTLMNREKLQWLIEHHFRVGLSLDGVAETHNILRKMKSGEDSFDLCAKALDDFIELKPNGSVIVVVDPRNVKGLNKGVVALYERGVEHITLNINYYTEWSKRDLSNLKKLYKKLKSFFVKCAKGERPLHISSINNKIVTTVDEKCRKDSCQFGKRTMVVAPSGNIYPCDRVVGNDDDEHIQMGNIATGFKEVNRDRILAESGNSNDECRECVYRSRCVNWCGCVNYLTTGHVGKTSGVVCFHEQLTIDIADAIVASAKGITFA